MKHIKLSFGVITITAALAMQVHAQDPFTNGLVAYYPFNGNANDATGNGMNGVVHGASLCPDRFGFQSSAYYFNGTNYIDFGNSLQLGQPHTAFTITFWFKAQGLGPIFGDYEGTSVGGDNILAFQMTVDNNPALSSLPNYLSMGSRNYPAHPLDYTSYIGDSVIIDGNWHAVVYAMDGVGACFVFLDGEQKATLPYDPNLNYVQAPHWQAGRLLFVGQWQYFTGFVDDIRIYSRAFSSDEVAQLYDLEAPPRIDLIKAVKPSFSHINVGTNYQLQVSADLKTWTNQGSPITATNRNMVYPQYWDVDNWNQRFFRFQVSP
jgi:hypothetical protein